MRLVIRHVVAGSSALLLAVWSGACSSGESGSDGSEALSSAATAASGATTLVAKNSGKCIDVPGDATTNDLQLQQYDCNGTGAQSFTQSTSANGSVTFKNAHTGLCIDVRGGSTANGTAVQQATCTGGASQQFTLAAVSGSTTEFNVKTAQGHCLDVTGQSTASEAKIQEWSCTGNANQIFTLTEGVSTAPPPTTTGTVKYLSKLGAKCNGSDDSAAFIAAVTGARNGAYTLVVDCASTLDIGLNVDRTVFIDNGTTIQFEGAGKVIVNNLFEPAFAIVNSSNIKLVDWNVEWNNSMPVSLNTDSYILGGQTHAVSNGNGSGVFNDTVLSGWLSRNRGVDFADGPGHGIWSNWQGSVNTGAIFYMVGSASDVTFTGLNLHSANTGDPSKYIPFGFTFGKNFKSDQTVTTATPKDTATDASQYFDVPRNISFDGVTLDGIIMGFQGNTIGSSFANIEIEHVSDLQDESGNNVGGVGQNFPPPHAFYLNYAYAGDPALFNSGITIENVNEVGPRLGKVRPGGGGYADSLKLGCYDCSVDGYTTNRKDGFMDVLDSENLTVTNVVATYDSSFVDQYENWPAWRWPGGGAPYTFKNITFSHVSITDEAATTVTGPVGNNNGSENANLVMQDVNVTVQSWTKGSILPTWSGLAPGSEITFLLKAQKETQVLK